MNENQEVKIGKYRHYKGAEVEVYGVAKHTETLEEFVVYRHLDTGDLWIRPKAMFLETITKNGTPTPRFLYIGE